MKSTTWRVDGSWVGDWRMPAVLERPLSEQDRNVLVELSCGGIGPSRLVRELELACSVGDVRKRLDPVHDPGPALTLLQRSGARTVFPCDDEYPGQLAAIHAPPPMLYVRGKPLNELAPMVAIVGSRVCTRGAARFTRRLAARLAKAGFTVVSGLARGIDAAAHEGALETGMSVAVLGTGIDRAYPSEHAALSEWVASNGALVGEFAPGTGPRQWHFPARNRIVSGLAIAVVVVEAGLSSGALITAGFAIDQGREVFACITAPENPSGAGVRELLRDGARLVVDPDDTTHELLDLAKAQGYTLPGPEDAPPAPRVDLAGDAALVYGAVAEQTTVDEVVSITGLSASRASVVLASLELEGLVCDDGGGRWRRTQSR